MRVDHLLIFTFPKRNDAETVNGGVALYEKYCARASHKPTTISLIETSPLNNAKTVTAALQDDFKKPANGKKAEQELLFKVTMGSELVDGKVDQEIADSDNVGIYLLCHGYGRRPTIYEAQTTSNNALADDWMKTSANRITSMLQLIGLRQLRKLSILMCGTAEEWAGGDPLFTTTLARKIKNTLKCPDFLAVGYDDYVTVVNAPEKRGTKLVGPNKAPAKESAENALHKRVYWVTNSFTSRVPAGWSSPEVPAWSDKSRIAP